MKVRQEQRQKSALHLQDDFADETFCTPDKIRFSRPRPNHLFNNPPAVMSQACSTLTCWPSTRLITINVRYGSLRDPAGGACNKTQQAAGAERSASSNLFATKSNQFTRQIEASNLASPWSSEKFLSNSEQKSGLLS
jgi:hypothetical protein